MNAPIKRPEPQAYDPKAWAWRLRRREHQQDRNLSICQKEMWRAALASELRAERAAQEPA